MESIEKLRESLKDCINEAGIETNRFDTYWITARACDMLIDEIEREVAERYMLLPCDADGVPIHVGDEMTYHGDIFKVCAVAPAKIYRWATVKLGEPQVTYSYNPKECKHYKPRTLEDVLRELIDDVREADGYDNSYINIAAAEIRELMEVGE